MYFCPCSCSKADCENEEDVLIYLPRNLSYAGESYLDRYSVSSAFVHNSKLEKQLLQSDVEEHYRKAGAAACAELEHELKVREGERREGRREGEEGEGEEAEAGGGESEHLLGARAMARPVTCSDDTVFRGGPDNCDVTLGDTAMSLLPSPTLESDPSSPVPQLTVTIERDKNSERQAGFDRYVVSTAESPDSDLVSEEGIFVNMMDDLDGMGVHTGAKSTMSEASDDTYVSGDSMYYSPVEVDDLEDEQLRGDLKVSLEEAVKQAAITFRGPTSPPLPSENPHSPDDTSCPVEDSVTLPLPHANDGDSDDWESAVLGAVGGEERKEGEDANQGHPGAEGVTAASRSAALLASKKSGSLEIPLTETGAAGGAHPEERKALSSSYRDLLSPDSPLYEDREFNFTRTELRKSTSLKSTKTPPGTPRRKKVVRFADAMGLDLESVRHVLNLESPPKIPPSAMKDLQQGLSEDRKTMGTTFITETFTQPGAEPKFRDRVMADKVVLENALIVSGSITGVVRVANIAFHKAVRVRFSTNGWASFHDIAASYMANSNDGPTDRFSFTLVPPPDFCPGSRLECAISYSVNGVDYWDNNYGNNYVFECYAKTVPTEAENAWMHFL